MINVGDVVNSVCPNNRNELHVIEHHLDQQNVEQILQMLSVDKVMEKLDKIVIKLYNKEIINILFRLMLYDLTIAGKNMNKLMPSLKSRSWPIQIVTKRKYRCYSICNCIYCEIESTRIGIWTKVQFNSLCQIEFTERKI
ncbi:hypothetical protein RFI_08457 [Reticulomyxa filosa]|uniref:Uncharacterized protein n=1 Tax=Reticulomyxa filosa TaxID=46433 RepID=X6NSE5_RETFI|nr:hypothetical protein RFI_08457 [Reticulomyxa filosa]|eukprot:ETO28669.1 hypothetical protein RFI_08457 [Reticulomyxa filosa]